MNSCQKALTDSLSEWKRTISLAPPPRDLQWGVTSMFFNLSGVFIAPPESLESRMFLQRYPAAIFNDHFWSLITKASESVEGECALVIGCIAVLREISPYLEGCPPVIQTVGRKICQALRGLVGLVSLIPNHEDASIDDVEYLLPTSLRDSALISDIYPSGGLL